MLKIQKKDRKVQKRVTLARVQIGFNDWKEREMLSRLLRRQTWRPKGKDMLWATLQETVQERSIRNVNLLLWVPKDRDLEIWNKAAEAWGKMEFNDIGAVVQKVTTASGFEEIDILLWLPDTSRKPKAVAEISEFSDLFYLTLGEFMGKIAGVLGACDLGYKNFVESLQPSEEETVEEIEVKDEDLLGETVLEQIKNSAE